MCLHALALILCFNSYNEPSSSHLAALCNNGFHKYSSSFTTGTHAANILQHQYKL